MRKALNVFVDLALVAACLVMFGGVLLFGMYAPLPPNETMPPYTAVPTDEGIQQQTHLNEDSLLQSIFTWLGIPLSEITP